MSLKGTTTERTYVRRILREGFGLSDEPLALTRVSDGMAWNWKVDFQSRTYLFKLLQSGFTASQVEAAAAFSAELSAQAIGRYEVAGFAGSATGRPYVAVGSRFAVLVPWIDGWSPPPNAIRSAAALHSLGRACGFIHRRMKSYQGAILDGRSAESPTLEDRISRLKDRVATEPETFPSDEVHRQLQVRLTILESEGPRLYASEEDAAKQPIHGDMYCTHAVMSEDTVAGIIDSMGSYFYSEWECMRCIFQSIPSAFEEPLQDTARRASAFLRGYFEEVHLHDSTTRSEFISRALDIYLLQLASSPTGLLPRANTDWWVGPSEEERWDAFGQWRTSMVEFLHIHRQWLGTALANAVAGYD